MSASPVRVSVDHPPLLLFYSRRIGLAKGHAIPILGGGKMTGKIGPYGIGILNVLTNAFKDDEFQIGQPPIDEPRTNYSVVRVNRDILKGSTIGGIALSISKMLIHTIGQLDSTFLIVRTREINIDGLWSRTFEADILGNSNAFFIGGDWRTNLFRFNSSYTDIGEDFQSRSRLYSTERCPSLSRGWKLYAMARKIWHSRDTDRTGDPISC